MKNLLLAGGLVALLCRILIFMCVITRNGYAICDSMYCSDPFLYTLEASIQDAYIRKKGRTR